MPRSRSPVVDRRRLAAALRELRERSRLTLEEAASRAIDASGAKLSRIENGKQLVSPRDVRDLCLLYEVSAGRLEELVAMAESAREPGLRESYDINDDDYADLESDAVLVESFQLGVVPGLLQTPGYARAFHAGHIDVGRTEPWRASEVAEWLEVLTRRQQTVSPDSETRFSFILDESVLLRPVGGPDELRIQLRHLLERAQQPNITLRVLPLSVGASPGQSGGFSLLTMSDGELAGYVQSRAGNHFIDEPGDIKRLRLVFHRLQDSALNVPETRALLSRLAETGP